MGIDGLHHRSQAPDAKAWQDAPAPCFCRLCWGKTTRFKTHVNQTVLFVRSTEQTAQHRETFTPFPSHTHNLICMKTIAVTKTRTIANFQRCCFASIWLANSWWLKCYCASDNDAADTDELSTQRFHSKKALCCNVGPLSVIYKEVHYEEKNKVTIILNYASWCHTRVELDFSVEVKSHAKARCFNHQWLNQALKICHLSKQHI